MNLNLSVTELASLLISKPSITPDDAGCQELIKQYLEPLGFHCTTLKWHETTNLYARFGSASPLLIFAGHTDVVPPGPLVEWTSPPFYPTIRDGFLYGRGACDMKSAIAAMLIATKTFLKNNISFDGSIAFLITSDEEGNGIDGTVKALEWVKSQNEHIDYCIVGEASSEKSIGDQIRIGRRGSLHATLTIHGQQGHAAYPDRVKNPIHLSAPFFATLSQIQWDQGNAHFPPTSFQITHIDSSVGARNVVPGTLTAWMNWRFNTEQTPEMLISQLKTLADQHKLDVKLDWEVGALPFLTQAGKLLTATDTALTGLFGHPPIHSTGGGTSDARFFANEGAEVIELGVRHETAHEINECVDVKELEQLAIAYERLLIELFSK